MKNDCRRIFFSQREDLLFLRLLRLIINNSISAHRSNIINNSISAHRSNNNQPCTTSQLIEILSRWQARIKAIVYCQRSGTVNIRKKLFGTGIVIIDAKTKLISHRKQKDAFILSELKRIHPKVDLEYKLLSTVWRNRSFLSKFKPEKKNRKKPSKKKGRK